MEHDSLGDVGVPDDALYGAQTQRAVENFPISGEGPHPDFVWATVLVKKAAATANMRTWRLEPRLGEAIVAAADEVLEDGAWVDQFVVDRFQAGAGTSHNMNANEVLANRANELLDGRRGYYRPVHPNDHVNMAQSSNDAVPAMVRLALLRGWERLRSALEGLAESLAGKQREFDGVLKTGRTHLQDAVPIRLGQEFGAYRTTVEKAIDALDQAADWLLATNLGATALGTGTNADPAYRLYVVAALRELTSWDLRPPLDYFQVTQSHDDFVRFSGGLRGLAVELAKLANDLRLLSSGPDAGFGDIALPALQPGSSIMPGKVNPVMAEMLDMVAFRVMGADLTVSLAGMHGQVDLNVFAPVAADELLTSLTLLTNGVQAFTERCVRGIRANESHLAAQLAHNNVLATALAPTIGYEQAAEISKLAVAEGLTVREAAMRFGVLPADSLDRLLDPLLLTEPGVPGVEASADGSAALD
ncbi:MAG: aspartate ammonia-lyase [Thermoleophilia bacterium]|nr:aspartate ammonia-lyase [Thermoleophilia bacterium]